MGGVNRGMVRRCRIVLLIVVMMIMMALRTVMMCVLGRRGGKRLRRTRATTPVVRVRSGRVVCFRVMGWILFVVIIMLSRWGVVLGSVIRRRRVRRGRCGMLGNRARRVFWGVIACVRVRALVGRLVVRLRVIAA